MCIGPVPTGTDCSDAIVPELKEKKSRPYGDGLFLLARSWSLEAPVPSLRGRIVPWRRSTGCTTGSPVPTGTDCSAKLGGLYDYELSRPYGDGLFLKIL